MSDLQHSAPSSLPLWSCVHDTDWAAQLATAYGFVPVLDWPPEAPFVMRLDEKGLSLVAQGLGAPGPVWVDFVGGEAAYRRRSGLGALPVAKAVGIRPHAPPTVLDATAGLGGDSYILASLGCEVTAVERHPIPAALFCDALRRARLDSAAAPAAERITLLRDQAIDVLARLPDRSFDTVFLDPMFPEVGRTAQVKKGMQLFQQLLSGDVDADALLAPARRVAARRVVVKRPRLAPVLAGVKPAGQQIGKSTRFDLYAPWPLA